MPYVMSFERIAKKEGRKEGRKEGLKEGREEGREEGLQQGSLLTLREIILEDLNERFGRIPAEIPDILNQITDKDRLKMLHRLAIKCVSLEEYVQMLHERM